MRVILIGDVHAYRLLVPPWLLLGKPVAGYLNLLLRRRRMFRLALMPALVERALALKPDLVLLSGDLTTCAFPGEFDDAARLLKPLTDQVKTIAVPGNHDRYTRRAVRAVDFEERFQRWATSSLEAEVGYPVMHPVAPRWHVLALDSGVPRWLSSRGRIGAAAIDESLSLVNGADPGDGVIVLSHYAAGKPPHLRPMRPSHMLEDHDAFLRMLAQMQRRLIFVHGHIHCPWSWPRPEAELRHVLDVNAGAPCLIGRGLSHGQGFVELRLPDNPAHAVQVIHHRPTRDLSRGAAVETHANDWSATPLSERY